MHELAKPGLTELMKRTYTISNSRRQGFPVRVRTVVCVAERGPLQFVFQRKRDDRSGFSLFELMIVVAIILAVTAMAAPGMMERVRSGRVKEAAEEVSTMLANARTQAIDTGVDYHFRFELDGHSFVAIPAEIDVSIGNSNNTDPETAEFSYSSGALPEAMFLRYSQNDKSGSETLKGQAFGKLANAGELASKNWSEPILFRFDGSSESKTFRVMDELQRSCDVSVRGLTGAISTSGVFIMENK